MPKSQVRISTAKKLFDEELIDEYWEDKPDEKFIGIPRWLVEKKGIKTEWNELEGLSIKKYEEAFQSEIYSRGTWDDIYE